MEVRLKDILRGYNAEADVKGPLDRIRARGLCITTPSGPNAFREL